MTSAVLGTHPYLLDPSTQRFICNPPDVTTERQRHGNRQLYSAVVDALGRSKDAEAATFLDRLARGAMCAYGDGLNLMRALERYKTFGEEQEAVYLKLLGQLRSRDATPLAIS